MILLAFSVFALAGDYTCGNGICNENENYYSCEKDCISGEKDNYCDNEKDKKCDPDCINTDPDCENNDQALFKTKSKKIAFFYLIGSISSIGIIALLILIFKKVANQKIEEDKKIYTRESIDKFSNINKQKQRDWSNKTEAEIMDEIKQDEKYKEYFNQKEN